MCIYIRIGIVCWTFIRTLHINFFDKLPLSCIERSTQECVDVKLEKEIKINIK